VSVPFVDLSRIHAPIAAGIEAAMARVIGAGDFILGRAVEEFEQRFAAYCGGAEAVGVSSGTDALHLALLACGVGPGDEVITVPNTFIATAFAISYTGARPVFVDIDAKTGSMDAGRVAAAVTPRTKALIPVHLFGLPADMGPLLELARRHGLMMIEDACQAHGARWQGRPVGALGTAGCFSFYPAKNLGAFGDGGMVVTNDPRLAARMRSLRNYGSPKKYEHLEIGYNRRLDTLQAAVLGDKLGELDGWNGARRRAAGEYAGALAGIGAVLPLEPEGRESVYHLYVVRVAERERVMRLLAARGVGVGIHYPYPLHLTPAYRDLGYRPGSFPIAERFASQILSLPMFPGITAAEIRTVAEVLREAALAPCGD
jgi:dTDP-4-amino-4,6-dideoxygalactose transaminase